MSHNIIHLSSVDSTNSYIKLNLDRLSNRDIIVADMQTNGRGRLQRRWISSSTENLYFSIALKDIKNIQEAQNITQVSALVLVKILDNYGIKSLIKWPNDVLVNNKKISGILSETVIRGDSLEALVLGIGINVNIDQKSLNLIDQPATSLYVELRKKIDKLKFLNDFLDLFFIYYNQFLETGFSSLSAQWKGYLNLSGKSIIIKNNGDNIKAIVIAINDDGTLTVDSKGKISRVCCGDIEIV